MDYIVPVKGTMTQLRCKSKKRKVAHQTTGKKKTTQNCPLSPLMVAKIQRLSKLPEKWYDDTDGVLKVNRQIMPVSGSRSAKGHPRSSSSDWAITSAVDSERSSFRSAQCLKLGRARPSFSQAGGICTRNLTASGRARPTGGSHTLMKVLEFLLFCPSNERAEVALHSFIQLRVWTPC